MDTDNFMIRLFGFFVGVAIIYLVGAFITFDPNPLHWILLTRWWGRTILLILLIINGNANFSYE